ncbi:MAG: 3-phosphoshikimate 1-carboxyvinyltransferase, partial [Chitinophagaceae bacterium]
MKVTITPSRLSGTLQAPASKSSMQRACAAALVAGGKTLIKNHGHSNDDKAALSIITALGAKVFQQADHLEIQSEGIRPVQSAIHCGESGLSIRMFTPLVALSDQCIQVTGAGSLTSRPLSFFDEILPQLGVQVVSNQGKLPLQITGPLQARTITIDGSLSSQFLTGLLFAYAALDATNVSIHVVDLKSRPYIDLTLEVMKSFGMKVPENRNYSTFHFGDTSSVKTPQQRTYTVEGDWSGAAFLLVAGAICGPLEVKGLDLDSTQADKAIVQALMQCGAGLTLDRDSIRLAPVKLRAFQFDATDCPDLFPPLVALASYCSGVSSFTGVSRLAHKESDRALTLQQEFKKLGVPIELEGDVMKVQGASRIQAAQIHSHHDHRIAM